MLTFQLLPLCSSVVNNRMFGWRSACMKTISCWCKWCKEFRLSWKGHKNRLLCTFSFIPLHQESVINATYWIVFPCLALSRMYYFYKTISFQITLLHFSPVPSHMCGPGKVWFWSQTAINQELIRGIGCVTMWGNDCEIRVKASVSRKTRYAGYS